MAKAFIIPLEGKSIEIQPKNGTDFKLEELYKHIGCDMIEVCRAPELDGEDMILIIDEEGKMKGDYEEIFNKGATTLVRPFLFTGDFVAGRAVYCPDSMLK